MVEPPTRLAGAALLSALLLAGLWGAPPALAGPASTVTAAASPLPVADDLCRLIDAAAARHYLPPNLFARLIWQESRFHPRAVSPAGALGIAQFMPGTAAERGLADPFDPNEAIPASAAMLAELSRRFGNFGLAAAAYNSGSGRLNAWLSGGGGLPPETRDYVFRITGRSAETWAGEATVGIDLGGNDGGRPCAEIAAARGAPVVQAGMGDGPVALWPGLATFAVRDGGRPPAPAAGARGAGRPGAPAGRRVAPTRVAARDRAGRDACVPVAPTRVSWANQALLTEVAYAKGACGRAAASSCCFAP